MRNEGGACASTRLVTAMYLSISTLQSSPRAQRGLHFGVAEFRKRGLVDLYIAAAGIRQRGQLADEGRDCVPPERLDILVGVRQDDGIAAAEMQRAGAGNGDFRHQPAVGGDEREVCHVDRLRPAHAALDEGDRLRCPNPGLAALATLGVLATDRIDADVAERAIEEAVIRAAAELAVGRKLEADAFLKRERVPDGRIFRGAQRLPADLAAAEARTQVQEVARAQQAADVLGAEWGLDS